MTIAPEDTDLLQAYVDGELDPSRAAAMRERIACDPSLRAKHDSIISLRHLIREIPDSDVPLERLRAGAVAATSREIGTRANTWRSLAAAALIGAVLSGSATFYGLRQDRAEEISNFAVANHIRSLLAAQPFDVASSDRHTIKPWFTTKLPESPPVVDLGASRFMLAGGRVDVVLKDPVATIVYRRGAHAISLTTLRGSQEVKNGNFSGYNVKIWRDKDFTYVAVSDIPAPEIEDFARAFIDGLAQIQ